MKSPCTKGQFHAILLPNLFSYYFRGGVAVEDEQQGCFDPVILGPVIGGGCAVLLVFLVLISLFILILMVA